MPCSGASFFVAVMGEERFVPYGYVAFRDIPVRIEDAAFLRSKGVRNLSTPLERYYTTSIVRSNGVPLWKTLL